jgi:hypothetical protein
VGHLHAVEECLDGEPGGTNAGDQLLLTEEWLEARKKKPSGGSTAGGRGGRDRGQGSGAQKTVPPPKKDTPPSTGGDDPDRDKCRYCGKKGHRARECRKKQRDEAAAAHLTQHEDDEEPGL